MADMLADGAAWMANQLKESMASKVIFVRGNSAVEVKATIAASVFESNNENGIVERWESRDFLIQAVDVPFGDPIKGDRIVETIDGIAITYDVASPRGVPLWRYGDAFRKTVRIHAVQADSGVTYITTEDGDLLIA